MRRAVAVAVVLALAAALAGPQAARAAPEPAHVPDEVVVQYREGATAAGRQAARARAVPQSVARVRGDGAPGLEVVRLPRGASVPAAVVALQADPAVRFAEPNWRYSYEPNLHVSDPIYRADQHWGVFGDVRFPEDGCAGNCANRYGSQANAAWAEGLTGGRGVYVGVIDSGIMHTHEDLAANIWTNPFDPADGVDNDGNGYADDVRGWNFAADTNETYVAADDEHHGTHVAGTIGAAGDNGVGVAGVNWRVTLVAAKFFGGGPGGGSLESAVRALDYFIDLKRRHGLNLVAVNASWGCYCPSQALHEAIARADSAGILVVAATGNDGRNIDRRTPYYPASYELPNVVAVAAIDEHGNLASFSNYGPRAADLGAPGVGIGSTLADGGYGFWSGTSMAAPHVAGAAALYAAHTGASGAAIKAAILQSAHPTAALRSTTASKGRLDISCLLRTATCDSSGP